jgi:hypothetical protein
MRKLVVLAAAAMLLGACANDEPTVGSSGGTGATTGATGATSASGATGATAAPTAASCAEANASALAQSGTLTVGTGNPAYPPWWSGGESPDSDFQINDPAKGEG